jgi:hypothetical protein
VIVAGSGYARRPTPLTLRFESGRNKSESCVDVNPAEPVILATSPSSRNFRFELPSRYPTRLRRIFETTLERGAPSSVMAGLSCCCARPLVMLPRERGDVISFDGRHHRGRRQGFVTLVLEAAQRTGLERGQAREPERRTQGPHRELHSPRVLPPRAASDSSRRRPTSEMGSRRLVELGKALAHESGGSVLPDHAARAGASGCPLSSTQCAPSAGCFTLKAGSERHDSSGLAAEDRSMVAPRHSRRRLARPIVGGNRGGALNRTKRATSPPLSLTRPQFRTYPN